MIMTQPGSQASSDVRGESARPKLEQSERLGTRRSGSGDETDGCGAGGNREVGATTNVGSSFLLVHAKRAREKCHCSLFQFFSIGKHAY